MTNEIKKTDIKFTPNGDQILEEIVDGGGKTQTIKYGLIKLIGEKKEYRISYKTLLAINEAQNAKFKGKINIPEINMSVQASQIVILKSETETVRVDDDITKFPYTNLILNLDFTISNKLRLEFLKEKTPYYEAVVHYKENNGNRECYLGFDRIKRLLKVEFDKDGYDFISHIYEYGVEK